MQATQEGRVGTTTPRLIPELAGHEETQQSVAGL